jgi:hypothetical protein
MSEPTAIEDQAIADLRWYQHYSYLLKKEDIFEILFPGRHATNNGSGLHNDVIIITGKKGVGKTELAKMFAYIFNQHEPEDKIAVFCGIPDLYEDLSEFAGKKFLQIDLDEIEEEGEFVVPPVEMFQDTLVIFDDTEKHESKDIEKMLWRLVNTLAQKGRNFRVTLICILHQLNKGITSNTLLREMDALVIFPHYFDMNTFNSIIHHIGIPKEVTEALFKLDERFILIRNSAPQYFFLGTSMEKTANYNTILKLAYGNQEDMEGGCECSEGDDEGDMDELINILNGKSETASQGTDQQPSLSGL